MTALDKTAVDSSMSSDGVKKKKKLVRFTSNIVGPIYFCADVLCFLASAPIAVFTFDAIRGVPIDYSVHLFAMLIMAGSFFLIRYSNGAYERSIFDPVEGHSIVIFAAVVSWLVTSALIWQVGMIENYSRGLALSFVVNVAVLLVSTRPMLKRLVKYFARQGQIQQRIALYGADPKSVEALSQLVKSLGLEHLRVVGLVDERSPERVAEGLPLIGGLEQLRRAARAGDIDQVLICGSNFTAPRLKSIVDQLSDVAIDISVIPREAVDLGLNYQVNLLGTWPVLTLWQRPFRDINQIIKRGEDLILGSVAIIGLMPVFLFSAVLVRLSSRGPIFFVQPRLGFNNEIIHVYKFRTMYAEKSDIGGRVTTSRKDPRVTPVGRWLRRLSVDELPQLLNVLSGTMSLVGPRPHAVEMKVGDRYYHEAVRGYAGRHRVKPGITGLAQVRGLRGEVRTIERAKRRVELDQYYLNNWSLWLDLKILLATARAAFFDSDAY